MIKQKKNRLFFPKKTLQQQNLFLQSLHSQPVLRFLENSIMMISLTQIEGVTIQVCRVDYVLAASGTVVNVSGI